MFSYLLTYYLIIIFLFHLPLKKLIDMHKLSLDIFFFIISNIILIIAILVFYFYYQDKFFTIILNSFMLINTCFYGKELYSYNPHLLWYIIPYFINNILFMMLS